MGNDFVSAYINSYKPIASPLRYVNPAQILSPIRFFEKFMPIDLFLSERVILKILYGNVDSRPEMEMTKEDYNFLEWHKNEKELEIQYKKNGYRTLLLIVGRTGGKSFFEAFIDAYELYRFIKLEDPHSFFKMPDTPLHHLIAACSLDQTKQLFSYVKSIILDCSEINKYLDGEPSTEKISIFTPEDMRLARESQLLVKTLPSKSSSSRSYRSYIVNLDEFAHFISNDGNFSDDAIYNAIEPTVKMIRTIGQTNNFNFGKIILTTSPLGKSGKTYKMHNDFIAGKDPDLVVFRMSTWDFNPNFKRIDFDDRYRDDPIKADMEYGANFAEAIDSFFPADKIELAINPERKCAVRGDTNYRYVVTIDLSKTRDRTVIAVGHLEKRVVEGQYFNFVIVDLLKYWEAQSVKLSDGTFKKVPINQSLIEQEIVNLPQRGFLLNLAAADQYNSSFLIERLKDSGIPAIETTFTNQYKDIIYPDLLKSFQSGTVEIYGKELTEEGDMIDESSPLRLAVKELKFLQRQINGKTISYHAPTTGEVTHDDFADCIANLNHLLTSETSANEFNVAQEIDSADEPLFVNIRGLG
jgi:hypothetical protein